jgi:hypothetical protein
VLHFVRPQLLPVEARAICDALVGVLVAEASVRELGIELPDLDVVRTGLDELRRAVGTDATLW